MAALADSFITSPSVPVSCTFPRPPSALTSTSSTSPPAVVYARPVATPTRSSSVNSLGSYGAVPSSRLRSAFRRADLDPVTRQLPRHASDPPLEFPHAGFARVGVHDCWYHVRFPRHRIGLEPVLPQLLRREEASRDRVLLLVEVARQANDFH